MPISVLAVDYLPLVPCGISSERVTEFKAKGEGDAQWTRYDQPCSTCDGFRLAKNVIDLVLYGIVPAIATGLFIIGGLMILLGGASEKWVSLGRTIFWDTFIGLIIIFSAWLIANTFIKSFGPNQIQSSWNTFLCEDETITPPGVAVCSNPQQLAQQYSAAFPPNFPQTPGINAPELDQLISCVNSRIGNFIDQSQIYTYERTNPLCNLTKGDSVCGTCQHTVNSCHYGGTQGSQAVDFNAQGISEVELYQELSAIYNVCNFGFILFESTHTHVSTQSCAGN